MTCLTKIENNIQITAVIINAVILFLKKNEIISVNVSKTKTDVGLFVAIVLKCFRWNY